MNKISGPMMDRIDLHIEVTPVPVNSLLEHANGEPSDVIRQRVITTRGIQIRRFAAYPGIYCNAQMSSKMLQRYCKLDKPAEDLLRNAINKLKLSARAYDRILKVSRTIADMGGCENIQPVHIGEAIQLRSLDRENWWG
jgi:magnesium chelatase family protein